MDNNNTPLFNQLGRRRKLKTAGFHLFYKDVAGTTIKVKALAKSGSISNKILAVAKACC